MMVCDSCYRDSNYCDYHEENTFQDVESVYLWRHGRVTIQHWSDGAISDHAELCNGHYWSTDDLVENAAGDYITPEQIDNGEYFLSEWDGEYYSAGEMCETEEGEIVSKTELEEGLGIWEQGANGVWRNVQMDLELPKGEAA